MTAKRRQAASAPVHLRRMYLDVRYGQLHLTTAYPASGGFDEATPVIFLHADEGSGSDFNPCAVLLGTDRSIFSPDMPGSGGSDAPKGRLPVAGLALAIVDLIEHLRLRRVDLIGAGRGALVAYELANTRAQEVRRIVIAGGPEPTAPIAQPMIRVTTDPARILEEPADELAGEIRSFLDRI